MATDENDEPIIIPITPELIDEGYREAFGETREAAQAEGHCVICKGPPRFYSEAGRREYQISGVCEPCFDQMFAEPE